MRESISEDAGSTRYYADDGKRLKHNLVLSTSRLANCSLFSIVASCGVYYHCCNYKPRSKTHRNADDILYIPEGFGAHSPNKQLQSNCPGAVCNCSSIISMFATAEPVETGAGSCYSQCKVQIEVREVKLA